MKGKDINRIKLVLVEKKRILDKIADILEIDIRELLNGRNKQ